MNPLISRMARHLASDRSSVRKHFPPATLDAIERAVADTERMHQGELRLVIEPGLTLADLWRRRSARDRAIELFGRLGVWDTEHNSGVLIYVLLADYRVEIVADRGVHRRAGDGQWSTICGQMQAHFAAGRFEAGTLAGIAAVGALLTRHFPHTGASQNELPDRPLVL